MTRTLAEVILSRVSGRDVQAGDLVIVPVSRVMVHDSVIDAVMGGLRDLGREQVWDTAKVCVFVDHAAPAPTPVVADSHRVLREWVRAQKIPTFYDAGEGVCHQIMVEEGYCEPGTVIVGSDSHSNSYGAVGAFGAGMGATDVAVALALGRTWLRVPASIKVEFTGRLRKGITMKDAIMRVVREIGTDGARYACVEFHGVGELPQGDRITLAGMTTEMGAKAGIVVGTPEAPVWLRPDPGAPYMRALFMDFPHDPKVADLRDEYMFGPALLIAPVTEQGATSRAVYLPAGTDWYNYWTNQRLRGGQTIQVDAPIDILPMFVRAGSILPLGDAIESTSQVQKIAKVRVYPGADAEFVLYQDDGTTYAYEQGDSRITHLHWNDATHRLDHQGVSAWTAPDSEIVDVVTYK